MNLIKCWYKYQRPHPLRAIKKFWQRGRKGWSEEDVWDLHHYLSGILAGALMKLAENAHGHPCRMMETEKSKFPDCCNTCQCAEIWEKELRENAEKFRYLYEERWFETEPSEKWWEEEEKVYNETLQWLSKWYGHLWD